MASQIEGLEKKIGVKFAKSDLLIEALTHRSYLNEYPNWKLPHNERLEYLGDAVLELVITHELFKKFPDYMEGQLTVLRAALVNSQMLSKIAEGMELDDFMLMSRGERKDTGRAREVILANAIEAVIGAIYIDQGIDGAKKVIWIRRASFRKLFRSGLKSLRHIRLSKNPARLTRRRLKSAYILKRSLLPTER